MAARSAVELIGIEQAAAEYCIWPSLIRMREATGDLPPAMRDGGRAFRLYSRRDVDMMRRVLAARPDRRRKDRAA